MADTEKGKDGEIESEFSSSAFEALERDFQDVVSQLVADKALDRFRLEYEKLMRALKRSHDHERKLIKKVRPVLLLPSRARPGPPTPRPRAPGLKGHRRCRAATLRRRVRAPSAPPSPSLPHHTGPRAQHGDREQCGQGAHCAEAVSGGPADDRHSS